MLLSGFQIGLADLTRVPPLFSFRTAAPVDLSVRVHSFRAGHGPWNGRPAAMNLCAAAHDLCGDGMALCGETRRVIRFTARVM
jgi:hypothetical protein